MVHQMLAVQHEFAREQSFPAAVARRHPSATMAKKKTKKKDPATATTTTPHHGGAAAYVALDAATQQAALEMQAQEMEVLQAIFDRDLIVKSSTPLYAHIFCIHVLCESSIQSAAAATQQRETAEIVLHFDLGKGYPLRTPPNIDVENKHGLSKDEVTRLKHEMEQLAMEKLGDVMVYDLVMHATEFVQEHVKDQSSFFDQMMQRQQDQEDEKKREELQLLQLEEEEALARNQEILAMIDAERRKKMLVRKKSLSVRRRRRRHRSSIDIRGDGDDQSSTYRSFDGDGGDDDDDLYSYEDEAFESGDDHDDDDRGDHQERRKYGDGRSDPHAFASGDVSGETGNTGDNDGSSSSSSDSDSDSDVITSDHIHSRYHSDFKELGLLGRGGGGEVVKARNRLDRQLYAVKKIKLDPDDPTMKKKILREVKTISRMQHRHIVRYFQAWIEGDNGDESSESSDSEFGDSSCSESSGCDENKNDEDEEEDDVNGDVVAGTRWDKRLKSKHRDDDDDLESESAAGSDNDEGDDEKEDDDDDDWLGTMSNNSVHMWSKSKTRKRSSSGYKSSSYMSSTRLDDGFEWEALEEAPLEDDDDAESDSRERLRRHGGAGRGTAQQPLRIRKFGEKLYIQMEFCEGKALREVIDQGALCQDPDKIWTLFRQILEAIVYIHRQGIIHRDIKPPNIFLDAEGTVKLGDFGLAIRPQKIAVEEDEDDGEGDEVGDLDGGSHFGGTVPPGSSATNAFLAHSNGSSAAELYERLKLENLESTRMAPPRPSFPPHRHPHDLTSVTTMSYDPGDNITTGVGTAFYRAPEQEREGERYNQKADMFSLGVLFFEMWCPPFTTLMERAQALTGLREKNELPRLNGLPDNVKQIVLWLCQPNPTQRPSASELLASPLLPAKMEVEGTYLREALETLANPQGKFFGQLIDALLTQEPGSHIDYTYDHLETVKMRTYHNELRARTHVKRTLQKIFERHGSVEHATPLLMPRPPEHNYTGVTLATPQSACSLVDASGVSVTLPFDLTERLARFVARHNISRFKCYQFDRVYRKSVVGGGHPREFMEADFDIIWDDRGSFRFLELEGLQVVSEVIGTLSASLGSYYLRFNDARITKGIMDLCGVPVSGRRELLKLLSNEVSSHIHAGVPSRIAPPIKAGRWKFFTKKLKEHNVPQDAIDSCRPFFALPADPTATIDILETELQRLHTRRVSQLKASGNTIGSSSGQATTQKQRQKKELTLRRIFKDASDGVAALRNLLQGIDFLRLRGPLCTRIDIGLSPRPERYASGFVFQAVLTGSQQSATLQPNLKATPSMTSYSATTSSQVIAEGGRYDQLVTRFKLPAAYVKANHVAAMGVRFSVDKIVSCVMASLVAKGNSGEIKCLPGSEIAVSGGRSVLICSAGKAADTVLLRMQIAVLLWCQGIGADFLHPDPLHLEDLEDYCAQQRIAYMVIVQTHLMREKKQVKVRAVRNSSEGDTVVSCNTLVEFMQERLTMLAGGDAKSAMAFDGGSGTPTLGGGGGGGGSGSNRDLLHHHHAATAAPTLQPVFDVRVVDGKYYSKEQRGYKHMDNQKIVRRVSKWITSSFSARGEDAMKVLSVDLPFALMRELSSALMDHGAAGIEIVSASFPRYRKQIRYTAEEILALDPSAGGRVGRERYLLLHSLVDDRYDLMSLVHSSKNSGSITSQQSGSYSSGGGGGGGGSGGHRKGERDGRHVSRRSP